MWKYRESMIQIQMIRECMSLCYFVTHQPNIVHQYCRFDYRLGLMWIESMQNKKKVKFTFYYFCLKSSKYDYAIIEILETQRSLEKKSKSVRTSQNCCRFLSLTFSSTFEHIYSSFGIINLELDFGA